jgi:hypothetical protein
MPYEAQKNPAAGASKDEAAINDAVGGAAAQVDRNTAQVDAAVGKPTEQAAIQQGIAATIDEHETEAEPAKADAKPDAKDANATSAKDAENDERRALLKANIETAVAAFEARTGKSRKKSPDELADAAAPAIANPAVIGAKDGDDAAKSAAPSDVAASQPKEPKPIEVKDDEPAHADSTQQEAQPSIG